jgi:peptidoglycan/LPS O-acetylase OafA/YrhL
LCLFFTLSAYLICELLLREKARTGTVSMRRFYLRRVLRIWPLYFLGIAIGVAWAAHFGGLRGDLPWFTAYLLMAGNIYTGLHGWGGISPGPAGALWSISIEEQFYLLWPGLTKFASQRQLHRIAWVLIGAANLTLLYLGLHHAEVDRTVWTNSLVQFYMFGVGILLSLYLRGRMPRMAVGWRLLLAIAALAVWFTAALVFHVKDRDALATVAVLPGYALIAAGCAGWMMAFMGLQRVPGWIAYLGRISYGLYVFHLFAIDEWKGFASKHRLPDNPLLELLVAFAGSLLLAALSYRYFEAPFRRLKDKEAIIHSQPASPVAG